MKNFFAKNKVFLTGLISALCLSLYEFTGTKPIDWVVVGYAAFVAIGSYLAKNLRGQWVTIMGIILTVGANLYQVYTTGGSLDITQILFSTVIQIGMAVAPPPKGVSYEKDPTIMAAKK